MRSEAIVRGAGCLNRARPDLWEPRVSNRPRSPGRGCNTISCMFMKYNAPICGISRFIFDLSTCVLSIQSLINQSFNPVNGYVRIAPLLPGKPGDRGRTAKDNRLFLEAVLWRVRTGAPWRDLPERFGKWGSVWKRFRRWAEKGVFEQIFQALSEDPDFEYAFIDGTIVKVHRHGQGAKGEPAARRLVARAVDGRPR